MKNFEEVPNGEEPGRMANHLPSNEQKIFKDSMIAKVAAIIERKKASITLNLRVLAQKEKEILGQIGATGNFPEGAVASLFRWAFMVFFLFVSLRGEFVIWIWTLETFRLAETNLIAYAILVINLEGINHFLTYLRKQYSSLDNQLFLVLGCLIFVFIFLLLCVSADIRGNLWHMMAMGSLSSSPEKILANVEDFYGKSSKNFTFLMITLSSVVTLVSCISYHDLRARLFHGLNYWSHSRGLRKVRDEMRRLGEEMIHQDSLLQTFISDFDVGFLKEQILQSELAKEKQAGPEPSQSRGMNIEDRKNWAPILLPLFLILLALAVFFILKGTARGDTTVIALDLSISSGAVDYSGQDTEFQKNLRGAEDYIKTNTGPNQNVKIIGITEDSFGRRYVLVDGEISKDKGVFGESLARDRLNLLNQFKKHDLKPNAKMTDLFGAMQLAEVLFGSSKRENKLIIFSDMRHFRPGIDFESPRVIDVDAMLKEVVKKSLVAHLGGVRVWCLGVHSVGKTPAYWMSLKDFWTRYFQEAKVSELKAFTMERKVQNE